MAAVLGPRTAGMPSRAWAGSQTVLSLASRPSAKGCSRQWTHQQVPSSPPPPPGCRSLFQSTSPRQRRGGKGPKSGQNDDIWPASINTPPPKTPFRRTPLPYRSALPPQGLAAGEGGNDSGSGSGHQQHQQPKGRDGRMGREERREALDSLFSQRKLPLVGAALAAGVIGFCTMPLLLEYLMGRCNDGHAHEPGHAVPPDAVPTGLPPMGAAAFDVSLDVPERMMGIGRLREKLALSAHGSVLEVAVGTGRNVCHYIWDPEVFDPERSRIVTMAPDFADLNLVTSFTGIDLSGEALGIARRRLRVNIPAVRKVLPKNDAPIDDAPSAEGGAAPAEVVNVVDSHVRLFRGDAMHPLPPPAPSASSPAGYDTVVQTFGLCSVADPVVLLANMAAVVKPDTGRIVLLEHGRGRWSVVNALLDRYAGRHFSRFGCWWNRDMMGIVAKAQEAVPGLELVEVKRPGVFQFGTLWWIELRVKSQDSQGEQKK